MTLFFLSNEVDQAQILLNNVQVETVKVGLHINVHKTKFLALNQQNIPILTTTDGRNLECVSDYKYLGSWIGSTEKDVKIRKALAWKASNKVCNFACHRTYFDAQIILFALRVRYYIFYFINI